VDNHRLNIIKLRVTYEKNIDSSKPVFQKGFHLGESRQLNIVALNLQHVTIKKD